MSHFIPRSENESERSSTSRFSVTTDTDSVFLAEKDPDRRESVSSRRVEPVKLVPPPPPTRSGSLVCGTLKDVASLTARKRAATNSDNFSRHVEDQVTPFYRNRSTDRDPGPFGSASTASGESSPSLSPLKQSHHRSLPSLLDHVTEQQDWESDDGESQDRKNGDRVSQSFLAADNPCYIRQSTRS